MLSSSSSPPAQLPPPWHPPLGPVVLRPLTLADNAAAFVLSEIAFFPHGEESAEMAAARQARWDAAGRQWFGWLQAQSGEHCWAATVGEGGPLAGYARVIRDDVTRREQLTELFVHPHFQGGQVGKALLGATLSPTVPAGWGRVIIADLSFPAMALYHRWGVAPLGVAWHGRMRISAESPVRGGSGDAENSFGDLVGGTLNEHEAMVTSMQAALGAEACQSAAGGYGVRCGASLGPVVGASPADALRLMQSLIAAAQAAGHSDVDFWVPGANVTVLRWLRDFQPRWDGQVALLASHPALVARMERSLLVAPPYLW